MFGRESTDDGAREIFCGIESEELAFEVNPAHPTQSLYLARREGAVPVGPLLSGEIAIDLSSRQLQLRAEETDRGTAVDQLVGRHADMIELLGHCERHAIAVEQRSAPRRQHRTFSPLRLRFAGPACALEQLQLGRTTY